MEEHFLQFGKIHKIITEPEKVLITFNNLIFRVLYSIESCVYLLFLKNSYAIVEFEESESVENALNCAEHKVNGKNLKISRREMKSFVPKVSTNGEKKKETLEKLKEEALAINTILGKCESVNQFLF